MGFRAAVGMAVILIVSLTINLASDLSEIDDETSYSPPSDPKFNSPCNPDNTASGTVTITDLTNINNGDKVTLIATDGTSHDFTAGDVAGGGTWIAETNNNTSATNLMTQINANTKFSASANGAVVTITQAVAGVDGNTAITLVDNVTDGMAKTDFTGGCDDTDDDGIGDDDDDDDDNDLVLDVDDAFPYDPYETVDTDGDGVGDNADLNDDGDGWTDAEEDACGSDKLDADSVPDDYDDDGLCDKVDTDDDGDGTPDTDDAFQFDATENADLDGDGWGDNVDVDDDDDGWLDYQESNCGTDPRDTFSVPADNDHDYQCDIVDPDDDNDGILDSDDDFPMNPYDTHDRDGDGIGDNADAFPDEPTQWYDYDGDGLGDNPSGVNGDPYPGDYDNDGEPDETDVFPDDPEEWLDSDGDGIGDNMDDLPFDGNEWLDTDGDGVGDNMDDLPFDGNEWLDTDGDGVGDNSDDFPEDPSRTLDRDGDGIAVEDEGGLFDMIHGDYLPGLALALFILLCLVLPTLSFKSKES